MMGRRMTAKHNIDRLIKKISKQYKLNVSEWFIVVVLIHNNKEIKIDYISKQYNLQPQRIYYIMKRIEKKGLIKKKQDPNDGRGVIYYLDI